MQKKKPPKKPQLPRQHF